MHGIDPSSELAVVRCQLGLNNPPSQLLREGEAAMQAKPFSGVTVPLDVEAVAADPVEAGEGGAEPFAEISGKPQR